VRRKEKIRSTLKVWDESKGLETRRKGRLSWEACSRASRREEAVGILKGKEREKEQREAAFNGIDS